MDNIKSSFIVDALSKLSKNNPLPVEKKISKNPPIYRITINDNVGFYGEKFHRSIQGELKRTINRITT